MSFFRRTVPADQVIAAAAELIPPHMSGDLRSLILHGAHAESAVEDRDDDLPIHLLIVLHAITPETIRRLAESYQQISGHHRIAPMVLSLEELQDSTDVFPITFLEMQRCHRLLAGEDVLADLSIGLGHLRLRCEQELKNLLLRMQNSYLVHYGNPKPLKEALHRNYASLVRTLGATLLLRGKERPTSSRDVLSEAASDLNLDLQLVDRIQQAADARFELRDDVLSGFYAAFLSLVGRAAAAVNHLPASVSLVEIVDSAEEGH